MLLCVIKSMTTDLKRPQSYKKRVGRPREHWAETNINRVYQRLFGEEFDEEYRRHVERLKSAANERLF